MAFMGEVYARATRLFTSTVPANESINFVYDSMARAESS